MKGEWVQTNSFTEEVEFFYIRQEHITNFEDAWTLYQQSQVGTEEAEQLETPPKAARTSACPSASSARTSDTVNDKIGQGNILEGQKDKGKKDKPAKKEQTPIVALMQKTARLKVAFHTATGQVHSVSHNIKTGAAGWQWANNDQNLGTLIEKVKFVQDQLTGDDHEILAQDIMTMRTNMNESDFVDRLQHFNLIQKPLEDLTAFYKKLTMMHKVTQRS